MGSLAKRSVWAVGFVFPTVVFLWACLTLTMSTIKAAEVKPIPGQGKYVRLVDPGVLEIRLGEREVAKYRFGENVPKPYLYPVLGPDGKPVTEDAPSDHVHHHSLYFSHDEVSGYSFWLEGRGSSPIRHERFLQIYDQEDRPGFTSVNAWMAGDKPLLKDTRTFRFIPLEKGEYLIDICITFDALDREVTFGQTKEAGLPGLRVAPEMRVSGGGKGRLVNSEGGVNEKECWSKPAKWVDYTGPRPDGTWVGIASMAHPSNRPYPPAWHARDYGLLGTNYTNWHEPKTLEPGESWTLKHRFYVHRGKTEDSKVVAQFEEYVKDVK